MTTGINLRDEVAHRMGSVGGFSIKRHLVTWDESVGGGVIQVRERDMFHSARWILKQREMECSSVRGMRLTRNADDVQWDGLLQEPIAEAMRHGNLQASRRNFEDF
jgi:hypothetical protein